MYSDNSLILQTEIQRVIPAFQVGTFLRGSQKIRAIIPVQKGFVFYDNDKNVIYNQIQYSLLTVLQQVEVGMIEITILDFTIERSFDELLQLSEVIRVEKVTDIKDWDAQIERFRQHALSVQQDLLMPNRFETLAQYNQSVEHPAPYHIVVLTDHWRKAKYLKDANALQELLEMGYKSGIFFICHLQKAEIDAQKAQFKQQPYAYSEPQEIWRIADAIQSQLIGIQTLPNQKVRFSNIPQQAFYRITQSFLFEWSVYPRQEVESLLTLWKQKSLQSASVETSFLSVPIGRVGNQPVLFEMGDKNGCFNAFIAGAVGSGKSSLLQHLILTIAETYSPDEFHFLILDYKNGDDFNAFKSLPHLEFLLLDNSRFDMARQVILDFLNEKNKRGLSFKKLSNALGIPIPNIRAYNRHAKVPMPFKLLIIDEIHELFFGSYKENKAFQDAFQLIVRQGRAYGLHILLCTQNLEGFNLGEGIMEQIKLRLAFQLASEKECRHVLTSDNLLPLDLERFEAVLNTHFGRVDNRALAKKYNTVFKTTFVGDIPARLQAIQARWRNSDFTPFAKTIVESVLPEAESDGMPFAEVESDVEAKRQEPVNSSQADEDDYDINKLWF